MKIGFITTVFNEESNIKIFLESLINQSTKPSEIVIVDGGSRDKTVAIIKSFATKFITKKIKFQLLVKKGNRSVGRNLAISKASSDVIACSDAGNILDKNWLKNISKPFSDKKTDVVAGYYKADAKTFFQKCLTPYVLVMPDKVNPDNFLPATRSIAFKKNIWEKVGGFDEKLSHNEDYVFANNLKKEKANIKFAKDAVVRWIPRNNFKEAFNMFYRFALGDAEAYILRPKVLIIFARYFLMLYFIFLGVLYKSYYVELFVIAAFLIYCGWSILKNNKYVSDREKYLILPALQFTSDCAVLFGTTVGLVSRISTKSFLHLIQNNKILFLMLGLYIFLGLFFLRWGAPNSSHPFPYHMDEWHQLNAVRATFAYGSPNTAGAANGTMFHFIYSGIFLAPFTLIGWVNPISLEINDYIMRARIFDLLRLNTLFFGSLSILLIYKIAAQINASKSVAVVLFTTSPIWLILSGYFKYDIALIFWILLSIYFLIRYVKEYNFVNFLVAGFIIGLAISVKVSAMPLLLIYLITGFSFSKKLGYKNFIVGLSLIAFAIIFFGMPDVLFGKGNIVTYLYENVIIGPSKTPNIILNINSYLYLYFLNNPVIFGYGLYFLFLASVIGIFISVIKSDSKGLMGQDHKLIYFSSLFFFISLLPLNLSAAGNRMLVLLPFFVLIISLIHKKFYKKYTLIVGIVLVAVVMLQTLQTFGWLYIKLSTAPQVVATKWMDTNLDKKSIIGLENIPIYELLPDIVQKEFYYSQAGNIAYNGKFSYSVIDDKSEDLPQTLIITNDDIMRELYADHPKNRLVKRLYNEGYIKEVNINPELRYFMYFGDKREFFISNILTLPSNTSIFTK